MKFEYRIPVAANIEQAWTRVQDHVALMQCLPGIEEVEGADDEYKMRISTKFGPVRLKFNGQAKVGAEPESKRMQADVRMRDSRSGSVHGTFVSELIAAGDAQTDMLVTADVNIAGKLGEFAQPLIKRKADQIIKEFSDNLKSIMSSHA